MEPLKSRLKNATRKFSWRRIMMLLCLSLLTSSMITISAMYLSTIGYADGLFLSYWHNPETLLFNVIPVFILTTFLALIFQSLRLSVMINGLFWNGLSLANLVKLTFRHAVLKPDDISLVIPALKMLPHYLKNFDAMVFLIAAAVLVGWFLFVRLIPKIKLHFLSRLCIALILVGLAAVSSNHVYASSELYEQQWAENEARWCDTSGITYRLHSDRYQANGMIYSFMYHVNHDLNLTREAIDEDNLRRLQENYGPDEVIPDGQKVHIITILLESYKDFSPEAIGSRIQWKEGQNPYAPLRRIQANALSGTMVADVFGGGTIYTETGVLSGLYRYPKYVNKPGYSNVQYFLQNGYQTVAMHPNDGYFYGRHNRYPNTGFKNFLYTQNYFKNNLQDFYPDERFFIDIKEQYDRYQEKGPLFLFAATMQGHGPYNCDQFIGREWFQNEGDGNQRAFYMLNNYFQSLYETGIALERLLEYLNRHQAPTFVIFFGDHSPALEPGAMEILGLTLNEHTPEAKLIQYGTPYVIWANQSCKMLFGKSFKGKLPTIDPQQMIGNILFSNIGWHGTTYHAFLQDFGRHISCQKEDFWCIDEAYRTHYPEEHKGDFQDLLDLNLYYQRQKESPTPQIDESASDEMKQDLLPSNADPDSKDNAATKSQTGKATYR